VFESFTQPMQCGGGVFGTHPEYSALTCILIGIPSKLKTIFFTNLMNEPRICTEVEVNSGMKSIFSVSRISTNNNISGIL